MAYTPKDSYGLQWGYRVMRHERGDQKWLALHEVRYGAGQKITSIEGPIIPMGATAAELSQTLTRMLEECKREPLDFIVAVQEMGE